MMNRSNGIIRFPFTKSILLLLAGLISGGLPAVADSTPAEKDSDINSLFGELLALAPKLNEMNLNAAEKNAMAEGLVEGFSMDTVPEEIVDQYDPTREAMQDHFLALTRNPDNPPALGVDQARLIGIMTAEFGGVAGSAFSDAERELIRDGFLRGLEQDAMSNTLRAEMQTLLNYLDTRAATYEIPLGEKIAPAERPYFESLRDNEDIQYNEGGLHWEVIDAGVGDPPGPRDQITVHYEGKLTDGTVFDSSVERGEPATFAMNGVIPGFSAGLSKIGKGGKVIIHIPAALGYGENPPPGSSIRPGDSLIFEAEIIDISRQSD